MAAAAKSHSPLLQRAGSGRSPSLTLLGAGSASTLQPASHLIPPFITRRGRGQRPGLTLHCSQFPKKAISLVLSPSSTAQKCSRCPACQHAQRHAAGRAAVPQAAGLLRRKRWTPELSETYVSLRGSGEAGPMPYARRATGFICAMR